MKSPRRVVVSILLACCVPPAPLAADLAGDREAVKLAETMLEALGGSRAWAAARTIQVELRGYYAREKKPWTETFWMELETPKGRFELRGGEQDRTIAWTPEGGWELAAGRVEPMAPDRHAFELEYWKRQLVVVVHRLAKGEGTKVAKGDDEGRFDVFDAGSGELLCQLALNAAGEPIKWGARIGEREMEHVLGPLESFGELRMPRWGASLDGIWRYEHLAVSLEAAPIPVSLEAPRGARDPGGD